MSDTAAAVAPTSAPSGGLPGDPGGMVNPLPPSAFDAAMAQMDFAPPPPPSNKIAPPADQTADPNVRTKPNPATAIEKDDSVQAQALSTEEQQQYEAWKASRNNPILPEADMERLVSVPWREGETRDVSVQEA